MLRLIFLGTPGEAVPPLVAALRAGHQVPVVITPPDRPAGRGRKPRMCPLKMAAQRLGLDIYQPENANAPECLERLEALGPDLAVAVAFGQILTPEFLAIPRLGCWNVHFSLLPAYRGAAPLERALMAGEAGVGVTLMQMAEKVDTGEMVLSAEQEVEPEDNAGTLRVKLSHRGADLLLRGLRLAELGSLSRRAQPAQGASRAPKIAAEEFALHWTRPARALLNLVQAAAPDQGAYTWFDAQRLKVYKASVLDSQRPPGDPGTVAAVVAEGFAVWTGERLLLVEEVQAEGRPRMDAAAFARGSSGRLREGVRLGRQTGTP